MKILLTNDDGIYAPGLAAMERALRRLGDVYVVAPAKEQSGVSHSITFLTPLQAKKVYVGENHWGWTFAATPADCAKLGISEILPCKPDLVVSGINGGLNAGVNILYSGTVAAAVEGALCGVTGIAVSLEYNEHADFHRAADLAIGVIESIWSHAVSADPNMYETKLFNINIPVSALKKGVVEVRAVGMDVTPYWESYEKRIDPMNRSYYWLTGKPGRTNKQDSPNTITDWQTILHDFITVTPLQYDMTNRRQLEDMQQWNLAPKQDGGTEPDLPHTGPRIRTITQK